MTIIVKEPGLAISAGCVKYHDDTTGQEMWMCQSQRQNFILDTDKPLKEYNRTYPGARYDDAETCLRDFIVEMFDR